jgi:hypothetical protein
MEHYAWEGAASVKFFTQDTETESKKQGIARCAHR